MPPTSLFFSVTLMIRQYQKHFLTSSKHADIRKKTLQLQKKITHKSYKQIIMPDYTIHAQTIFDSKGNDTENIKIHLTPKTKMAHTLKKHGLPTQIRKRELGTFSRTLDRILVSLEAHLNP